MDDNSIDYRELLLTFIGSLTLCEHMGDVMGDIETVLERAGEPIDFDDLDQLARVLHERGHKTLYNTPLV